MASNADEPLIQFYLSIQPKEQRLQDLRDAIDIINERLEKGYYVPYPDRPKTIVFNTVDIRPKLEKSLHDRTKEYKTLDDEIKHIWMNYGKQYAELSEGDKIRIDALAKARINAVAPKASSVSSRAISVRGGSKKRRSRKQRKTKRRARR